MLEQIVQVCVVRGVQMSAAMWICDDENQVWSSVAESGTDIKNSQDGTLKQTSPLLAVACIRPGFGRNIRTVT